MTLVIDDVVSAKVRWWEHYGNSPELTMILKPGTLPKHEEFVYEAIPTTPKDEYPNSQFLLSTNLWPVVKYVSIDDAAGKAQYHGALSGSRRLTDGRVHKSTSGWSSRSGAVNKHYYDRFPGGIEIMNIVVKEENEGIYFAGYDFSVDFAKEVIARFCPGVYLVRELKFSNWEPYWIPSTRSNRVVKLKP